jgi:hypothetical protein
MQITHSTTLLNNEGFEAPRLNALIPNEANYSAFLMQPCGQIEASSAGVRSKDRVLAENQFSSFLKDALSNEADLASSTFIVGKELTPQPIPFQQHETSAPREVGASVV